MEFVYLREKISDGVLCIVVDYSRTEHAGARGCFQICDIYIEDINGNEEKHIEKSIS